MYTCMYIHMYIHATVHIYKYGTRKNGRTTDQPVPISDQELVVYGPLCCHHTQVLDNRWATDRHKLTTDKITHHNWAMTSGLLQRPTWSYPILSTRQQFMRQCDKRTEKFRPARLYRGVIWVLPCYKKSETGAWHNVLKLQVEHLPLVVAKKGNWTNAKIPMGCQADLCPSTLRLLKSPCNHKRVAWTNNGQQKLDHWMTCLLQTAAQEFTH